MILGVTPARGGSRGIPRKNLCRVAGRPLLAWTIERALSSTLLDHYVVSTEDEEIADVARSLGAHVLARPARLAEDQVSTGEVLDELLGHFPEATAVVVLQATSPIRSADLVDRCIRRFLDEEVDSLATGYWTTCEAYGLRRGWDQPRQAKTPFFHDDGSVYVIRADLIRRDKDRFGTHLCYFETTSEENADVDTPFDLWLAEQILTRSGAGVGQGQT